MKLFDWRWLAASSLLFALAVSAETRPQYGGTVHVATRVAITSLDPGDAAQPDSFARRSLMLLMFDTLVTADESGRIQSALAASWSASANSQRWQLHLRRGVHFHDGTALTPEGVASSLRAANPSWNVSIEGDSVIVERESSAPQLLAELALPRNAVAKKTPDGRPSGTGPFHLVDWQPGKKLTLAADDNCWRGRPFLDAIEIEMGKSLRDQMTALELGKADLVEVAPEQAHRVSLDGRRLVSSPPIELLALMFARDPGTPEEKALREALALSVERGSIRNVLLQGAGQPAASILPNWMSGYAFVFSTDTDLPRARHTRDQVRAVPTWSLGYDNSSPLDRLLAERIALNAKDAGLSLQPTTAAATDLRLVRIPLASSSTWIALADVARQIGYSPKASGGSAEDLYATEQPALATQRIIPLFHLPASYASSGALKNWTLRPDGSWNLADAWVGTRQP